MAVCRTGPIGSQGGSPIETEASVLLTMATTSGAVALGFEPGLVTFDEGAVAGVIAAPFDKDVAIDPMCQVLQRDDPPTWIVEPAES